MPPSYQRLPAIHFQHLAANLIGGFGSAEFVNRPPINCIVLEENQNCYIVLIYFKKSLTYPDILARARSLGVPAGSVTQVLIELIYAFKSPPTRPASR